MFTSKVFCYKSCAFTDKEKTLHYFSENMIYECIVYSKGIYISDPVAMKLLKRDIYTSPITGMINILNNFWDFFYISEGSENEFRLYKFITNSNTLDKVGRRGRKRNRQRKHNKIKQTNLIVIDNNSNDKTDKRETQRKKTLDSI